MRNILFATALIMGLSVLTANAATSDGVRWLQKDASGKTSVNMYIYHSKDCEHCHKAVPYMKKLARQHPWIKLHLKTVDSNTKNIDEYIRLAQQTGGVAGSVPAFFYCGQMFTGYGENTTTGNWLLSELQACRANPAEFDISF